MLPIISGENRRRVTEGFAGLVGQEEAIEMLRRKAAIAIAQDPPRLSETLLLTGPPSTGKSELSERMATILGLPYVETDGRTFQKRDQIIEAIQAACDAAGKDFARSGVQGAMQIFTAPSVVLYVDEAHLLSADVQDAMLTLLDPKKRRVTIKHPEGARIIKMPDLCTILATTHPGELSDAFLSRCSEIRLRRYTLDEVARMVRMRAPLINEEAARLVAGVSRCTPRQAFMLIEDAVASSAWDQDDDLCRCIRRVGKQRGVVSDNGLTRDDEKYLEALYRLDARSSTRDAKPAGLNTILGVLHDVQRHQVVDEIEPWLLYLDYVRVVQGGRKLTGAGERYVTDARERERGAGGLQLDAGVLPGQVEAVDRNGRPVAYVPEFDFKRAAAGDKD